MGQKMEKKSAVMFIIVRVDLKVLSFVLKFEVCHSLGVELPNGLKYGDLAHQQLPYLYI